MSPRPDPWLLGLFVGPAIAGAAIAIAPRLTVSEATAAGLTFAGGAAAALLSLAIAARAPLPPRGAAAVAAAGALFFALAAIAGHSSAISAIAIDAALLAIGHAVGASIGRRVAHPGHLLPACAIAAAADVASVLHPAGPSRAIASSERALTWFALGFPVPGTRAVAPVIGLGDLVFIALVLGVVAAHRLSLLRAAVAAAAGIALAGVLSAILERPIPALVTIGAATVAGVPEARRLRAEDRRVAGVSVMIAAGVLIGVLVSSRG